MLNEDRSVAHAGGRALHLLNGRADKDLVQRHAVRPTDREGDDLGDVLVALRSAAGRDPHDRDLADVVGELATRSEEFRTHWAAHNARFHATAAKHIDHPIVGDLSLSLNRLDIAADQGLNLLGSWAATADFTESAPTPDQS